MKYVRFLFPVFILCVAAVGIAGAPSTPPRTAPEMMAEANQHFEKGESEEALEIYLGLVRQGFVGAALYYNLGNVYYRRGERGQAVLWYKRAERLSPRDPDIVFNLELALSHIRD